MQILWLCLVVSFVLGILPYHGLKKGCHFSEGVLQDWPIALGILGSGQGSADVQLKTVKLSQGLLVHKAIACRCSLFIGHTLRMPQCGSDSVSKRVGHGSGQSPSLTGVHPNPGLC